MHPMLNTAIQAARRAGNFIIRSMEQVQDLKITTKGHNDFVTEVDRKAESTIIETLRKAYPEHSFLAEESGSHGENKHQWIIDPLDGTTNFLHGYPQFAVSIALTIRGQLEVAVIYDPFSQELFTAARGDGAQLNNHRIRVSNFPELEGALIGTGFPIRAKDQLEAYLKQFSTIFPKTSGIRRTGSAALDLAYVASGRLDGFWESNLQAWDIAAGALLIQEAGGIVTDLRGSDGYLENGTICTGNPKVHQDLIKTLSVLT